MAWQAFLAGHAENKSAADVREHDNGLTKRIGKGIKVAEQIVPNLSGVAYDKYGRMKYHPDFHGKQNAPWTTIDQQYLIENYAALGPEQVSLALERTIHTVMTRAYELRKKGLMPKAPKQKHHKRIRSIAQTDTSLCPDQN